MLANGIGCADGIFHHTGAAATAGPPAFATPDAVDAGTTGAPTTEPASRGERRSAARLARDAEAVAKKQAQLAEGATRAEQRAAAKAAKAKAAVVAAMDAAVNAAKAVAGAKAEQS